MSTRGSVPGQGPEPREAATHGGRSRSPGRRAPSPDRLARRLRVEGTVQGVGFRPFVYRLAGELGIAGWVRNAHGGVEIHAEGEAETVAAFAAALEERPPPAAAVTRVDSRDAIPAGHLDFVIRASAGPAEEGAPRPTVPVSPDLPVCDACLAEMDDPSDRRHRYPYVNCTDCGPRYSIVLGLPYDRPKTTMAAWALCPECAREYEDPGDRRFHAQPVACPDCGPGYRLEVPAGEDGQARESDAAVREAARRLAGGEILAVKGLGGYHLACDAGDPAAVAALRRRKFRKEKPFALMARNLATARRLVELSPEAEELLTSAARPIVLAPAREPGRFPGVAPERHDLGVMLPYTPLHHLLFAAGAPEVLVMTSANRSSEPIAYRDGEARERLAGLADAFLVGERPIARRVDDSVARAGTLGPVVLRRARGYAPGAVARLPVANPVLALGGDLKSSITLVVGGEAFVSQHLGDLDHHDAFVAFTETVADLTRMYEVDPAELLLVHDLHPAYASTRHAAEVPAARRVGVQHHRAHVASVLTEHGRLEERVLGVAFDGTGWGDDGTIQGGEIFAGSLAGGFERVAHLRPAALPGGDAAARHPVQAAAGYLAPLEAAGELPDLTAAPFGFPRRYTEAGKLVAAGLRTFRTTSAGRLFDTAAALVGFTRETSFEGQAAMWLEELARTRAAERSGAAEPLGFPLVPAPAAEPDAAAASPPSRAAPSPAGTGTAGPRSSLPRLDFHPALAALAERRRGGGDPADLARAFHSGLARGLAAALRELAAAHDTRTVVLSGGVFQNDLLLADLAAELAGSGLELLANRRVPPNDGGLSLGQAALGALGP